jgi:hypothetical protein
MRIVLDDEKEEKRRGGRSIGFIEQMVFNVVPCRGGSRSIIHGPV